MKNNNKKAIIIFIFTLTIMLVIYFVINKSEYYFPKRENYNIYGIDLSYYQGEQIKWDTLLYGNDLPIEFVFLKASEGISLQDKMFKEYARELIERNICIGAYHYFIADISGSEQAKNFLSSINGIKLNLPYVIDIEEYKDREVAIRNLNTFIQTINNETNHEIMIYTNISTYYDLIVGNDLDHLPLWIASYRTDKPQLQREYLFWQYTDRGRLKGISTKVDLNVFNGSNNEWMVYKKKCGCL
jgi:lysozyme